MIWCDRDSDGDDDTLYLDAAWRGDPGWPRQEAGFPLGIWAPPVSPPALVDVDGDPELEIVFADGLRQIQVLNHDGSSATGWPVDVGVNLSDGPVAVGDLNGDGHPILAVGGTDGKAYAYDHLGNLLPGWPSAITAGAESIYVSIGAVGPPYQRSVVCAGGSYVTIRNRRGVAPPGAVGWSTAGATYVAPPAIGDIDGDGRAEIVCGPSPRVLAFEMGVHSLEFDVTLPYALSDAMTLGDLDQDGDLEIVCPTVGGILYVLDHTGALVGGNFPFDTGDVAPLTSAALAKMSGTDGPELVFAHRDWTVYGLHDDGTSLSGYPVTSTTGWYLWGAPIIGRIDAGANVAIGDRGDLVWSWTNGGTVVEGWPRDLQSQVNVSPAMGDIDLDGSTEVVVLTDAQVHVLDVGVPLQGAAYMWPMYGHDPQRTGCADCLEDLVTAVGDDASLTRVSFVGASPNPVSSATRFAFAVPAHAAANLEIIDLRGRRLCTVFREEIDAGPQVVTWNGRDAHGRPLASGQYFARLRVSGPNLDETLIRKLVVLR